VSREPELAGQTSAEEFYKKYGFIEPRRVARRLFIAMRTVEMLIG
jgi:hypothetical protein